MALSDHYNNTVDVYREYTTTSGFEPVRLWMRHINDMPCLVNTVSERERYARDGITVLCDRKLYCDVADIQRTDRVIDADNAYDIVEIKDPNERGDHYEILLKLLPPGTMDEMGVDSE